jgi:23S rRNA (uracil1939-C5)-methyltransferase
LRADEILSTGQIDGYRNKAVFHTNVLDGKVVIGFYRTGSHTVCPVERCRLLHSDINEALTTLWKELPLAKGGVTIHSGYNSMSSQSEHVLDGLVFLASDASFFQINDDSALLLYNKSREYANLSAGEVLADLYCGVGAVTLFLGRDVKYALGVENNRVAVEDAQKNARRNGLGHIEFVNADVAKWDSSGLHADCVVTDPPRGGLSTGAVQKLLNMSPERIVYISCDPATLARDVKRLIDYEACRVCAVDMFPRTSNVECCLLLHRRM